MYKNSNIKDHSNMFRIVCDPSSGSIKLYFTEIRSSSLMFVVCVIGVCQRNFETVVCVYCTMISDLPTVFTQHWFKIHAAKHRLRTQNIRSNFSEARVILPEDGSQRIRNMSEFLMVF